MNKDLLPCSTHSAVASLRQEARLPASNAYFVLPLSLSRGGRRPPNPITGPEETLQMVDGKFADGMCI